MKHTKRVLSMLLAIMMVLGVCPLAVFAQDSATDEQTETANPSEQKPYYTYYVQNGLTFLWSGENLTKSASYTTTRVKALVNILNAEQSINKTMYSRLAYDLARDDGNGGATFNAMNYIAVDGGVIMLNDNDFIYTDIVPRKTIDGVEVLTDMTFEVSQSYFDTVATYSGGNYVPSRGWGGGAMWYGPFAVLNPIKPVYKSITVGQTLYYYGEYADASGAPTPFYFTKTPKDAENAKYTYKNGAMEQITDQAVLELIYAQASADQLTVDGAAKSLTASDDNYWAFPAINGQGLSGAVGYNGWPLWSTG